MPTYSGALDKNTQQYSISELGENYWVTQHFQLKDFQSRNSDRVLIHPKLLALLERIFSHFEAEARPAIGIKLQNTMGGQRVRINSAYRTQAHNDSIKGSVKNSQHVLGKAADIWIKGVSHDAIADYAESLGVGGVGRYNTFTHVDVGPPGRRWGLSDVNEIGAGPLHEDDAVHNGAGMRYEAPEMGQPVYDSEYVGPPNTSRTYMTPDQNTTLLEQLNVRPGDEEVELSTLRPPKMGEIDIGDLRFGSSIDDYLLEDHLNQPTNMTQSNAGSVGLVDMLRTDMSTVIADNRPLPEVMVTLTVNATQRDDVNKVLRPLVAMQRRMPFTVARSHDLARMMLGLGLASDNTTVLKKHIPQGADETLQEYDNRINELATQFNSRAPSDIWIPITIRSITVNSQPGAPDLYQVHLVLRFANTLPYVQNVMFWKDTKDAVQWARYLGVRSHQGIEVIELSPTTPAAGVMMPNGKEVNIAPPQLGATQTSDPHQSRVFKKFYRGLLAEHSKDALEFGIDPPALGYGPSNSYNELGEPVYEPAYPISDNTRLFERYNPRATIGLSFSNPTSNTTREARLAKITRGFDERAQLIELMQNAATNLGTINSFDELNRLGKISPWTMALTRNLGIIYSTAQGLTSVAGNIAVQAEAAIVDNRIAADSELKTYALNDEGVGSRMEKLEGAFKDDVYALGLVKQYDAVEAGGAMNFFVNKRLATEEFVKLPDLLSKWQEATLSEYATLIHEAEKAQRDDWVEFIEREDTRFAAEYRNTVDRTASDDTVAAEFAKYMLSYQFFKAMKDSGALTTGQQERLEELMQTNTNLIDSLTGAVETQRAKILDAYTGNLGSMLNYLPLDTSAVENISMRFSNRYGDKEWDAYSTPVTQHIGGGNAEVTIDLTTNDPYVLDQLGAIRTSQLALSDLRKSRDVVPPLIDVYGPGNLLRSMGIKRLAYRAHTVTMAQDRPGYYQVRLDLLQDESTLIRSEKLHQAQDKLGNTIFQSSLVRPLFTPGYGVRTDMGMFKLKHPACPKSILGFEQTPHPGVLNEAAISPDHGTPLPGDVQQFKVSYRRLAEREASQPAFIVEVVYANDGDVSSGIIVKEKPLSGFVNIDSLFPGLLAFLEYAETNLTEPDFLYLLGHVEIALSTTGYSGGILLSIYNLATVVRRTSDPDILQEDAEWRNVRRFVLGGMLAVNAGNKRDERNGPDVIINNMTLLVDSMLQGGSSPGAALFTMPMRYAADTLAQVIIGNERLQVLYHSWVKKNTQSATVPYVGPVLPGQPWAEFNVLDYTQLPELIVRLKDLYELIAKDTPTCYPDLLMPEVRDTVTQTNLLAYDFPFGPGRGKLDEDSYLSDYRLAEGLHEMNQLQMAMVGMDLMTEFVRTEDGSLDGNLSESAQKLQAAYELAMADVRKGVARIGDEIPWPFSIKEDAPNYFDSGASDARRIIEMNAAVTASNQLTKRDWVNILRFAYTLKYVTRLLIEGELAAYTIAADENVSKDSKDAVLKLIAALNTEGLLANSTDIGAAAETYSVISKVQSETGLAYEREQLIKLFANDPEMIAAERGYTDPTAVAVRSDLRQELSQSWSQWLGFRRAFPSYMMLIVSQVGGGFFRVLADQYAWTAVQSIEIRSQSESAGQYCDLILSNMRWRLGSDFDRNRALIFDNKRDLTMKVKPGTYMHVYTGYGPDVGHLYPFAGRVVEFLPGPVSKISLASYGTTLNNPPAEGQGYFVNGLDSQHTIQESIIYGLSMTSGLEGLGRQSLTGAIDVLGRSDRGTVADDYRTSLMLNGWRMIGKMGLKTVFKDKSSGAAVSNMADVVSRIGITKTKEMALGDPRLYENIWVVTGRQGYGFANVIFGGTPEWLQNGKGWGWAAYPGETLWAQLNDQSLMFPDYVVATRPYNVGVPLHQAMKHPLRQTLYFGPTHGRYIYTDYGANPGRPFAHLLRKEADDLTNSLFAPYAEAGFGREQLYLELFYESIFMPALYDAVLQIGDGALDELISNIQQWGHLIIGKLPNMASVGESILYTLRTGEFFRNPAIKTSMRVKMLSRIELTDKHRELLINTIGAVFPGMREPVARYMAYLDRTGFTNGAKEVADAMGLELRTKRNHEAYVQDLLEGFADSLLQVAKDPITMGNLGLNPELVNHPALKQLQQQLIDKGYRINDRTRRFAQHYPANMYTQVCNNDTMAAGGSQGPDQDFANRILLSFPVDPDRRMSAFAEKGGTKLYTVQANPQIDPDALVEKVIYYPNLRSSLIDDAGLIAAQLSAASDGNEHNTLINMLEDYTTLVEQLREEGAENVAFDYETHRIDKDAPLTSISRAIGDLESALFEDLEHATTVKPKYQTVGHNLLKQSLGYMYQGTITMAGDPRVHTHDVLHLWDDVKEMHGPVSVGGVYHSFSSEGFYTVVQPRLYRALRGVDPTTDLLWMDFSFRMYHLQSWAQRIGEGVVDLSFMAGRIGMYAWILGSWFPPGVAIAAIADAVFTAVKWGYSAARRDLDRFVGIMTASSDANPIVIVPLTYKQKSYIAGLDGVHGPAAITTTVVDTVNRQMTDGNALPWFNVMQDYLNRKGPQETT